ncbi:TonB-dependent receptor [Robertkochia aurantiaca]|uniref:TonB-dependent receptor n=1 Tax=Robertkochia aurantiaca TaxID=2873700 RepID=UPI001CCF79DC|nr:TonB-dependent receptor [Robertkochia sp. 3YJGBD-33]
MKKLCLLLLFAGFLTCAWSQQTTDTLSAVILESEKLERPRQLVPMAEISTASFQRYNPADLINPLNETPGVYVFSGSLNTNRLTIRGIGSRTPFGTNKVKAYINQIPVTNGVGETSFGIFDPEALRSIEVIRGPASTVYGANLGGTLLLNPFLPAKGSSFISSSQTLGSFDQYKQNTQAGIYENDMAILFSYDHLQQRGYRDNNRYNRNGYLLNIRKSFSETFNLKLLINHIDYFSEIPSSLNRDDYLNNPTKAADNWAAAQGYEDDNTTLAGITAETRIAPRLLNTTSLFMTYNDHYEPRPFNILDETTLGSGFRTLWQYALSNSLQINAGAEYLKDRYEWNTYENLFETDNNEGSVQGSLLSQNREYRRFFNTFAELKWELERFRVQAGINYNNTLFEFNDLQSAGPDSMIERDFSGVWSPNLTIAYQITSHLSLFANTAHGYSYPSLEETLNPEGTINPEIKPESGWNHEIGFTLEDYGFNLKSSLYYMRVSNLLVAERTAEDQFIGRNAGKTDHVGLEYSLLKSLLSQPGYKLDVFINGSHNWHRFSQFVDDGNDFSGNNLTGVPSYVVVPGLMANLANHYYLNITGQFVGEVPITDANDLYSESYGIINLRGGYTTSVLENLSIVINGGINNLFDKKYASSVLINATGFSGAAPRYYYPGLPLNYFINLRLRWNL